MIHPAEYKLFFDGKAASRAQLDRVETVTVEQELGRAWEARIELSVCADVAGRWQGTEEDPQRPFARVRIEARVSGGSFVPLIDGPIVGHDTNLDSQPGQSSITLVVHDDSVYLNREEGVERLENTDGDGELARALFGQVEQIAETRIDSPPAPPDSRTPEEVRRGTLMDLLLRLARRNEMVALVLPGPEPGASIGVFQREPTEPDGLPILVLTGESSNLESFNLRRNELRGGRVVASTLSLSDKGVITRTGTIRDVELLGEQQAFVDIAEAAVRRLPPGDGESVDLQQRVDAELRRLSYRTEASGSIRPGCYPAVLQPFRVVTVTGIDGPNNGNYLITQVTHTLTRSVYTQSFVLKRNAESPVGGGSLVPGGIV
jgi:hypothetical protein